MRLAAVDVGTNTVRLLVAEDGAELRSVERDQAITRLGQGVDARGELAPAAMDRTVAAIGTFVSRARALGAERIRVAGTSALRDAVNREVFRERVERSTGLVLEVLGGGEEGRCAYAGAAGWLGAGSFVVCDIGGGSTELITSGREVSIDVGSVRLRERIVRSDPPTASELEAAHRTIKEMLEPAVRSLVLSGAERLVGVAGTVTTLATLVLGLGEYDADVVHGTTLAVDDVRTWGDRLGRMTAEEVRASGPVPAGRADVLVTGVAILVDVMDVIGASELIVSERDILDGLVLELAGRVP